MKIWVRWITKFYNSGFEPGFPTKDKLLVLYLQRGHMDDITGLFGIKRKCWYFGKNHKHFSTICERGLDDSFSERSDMWFVLA